MLVCLWGVAGAMTTKVGRIGQNSVISPARLINTVKADD